MVNASRPVPGLERINMSRRFWFVIVLMLVIAGCKSPRSDTSPFKSPFESVLPTPAADDSLSSVPATVSTATPVPPPQAGLGTVTGTLVQRQAGMSPKPMASALLFLAPLIYSTDGNYSMAGLDKKGDPMSITDETGHFVFPNVEAKEYVLVYSSGTTEFPLKAPDSNEDLLVKVVADDIIDLSEIYIEIP